MNFINQILAVKDWLSGTRDSMVSNDITLAGTVDATGTFKLGGTAITATAAELNRIADKSASVVTVTDDTTLTVAEHGDRIVVVDKADGAEITLPDATGSGVKFTVFISTTITSNSTTIKAANSGDGFVGAVTGVDAAGAAKRWAASAGDDTITLDGGTTGGKTGDFFVFVDAASGTWLLTGVVTQTGTAATPISDTLS